MTNLYTKKDGIASFSLAVVIYIFMQLVLGSVLLSLPTQSFAYNLLYAVLSASIFALAFVYAQIVQKPFLTTTKATIKPRLWHILWGCLATVGLIHLMLPLNELFFDLLESWGLNRPSTEIDLHPVALILVTVVIAPIGEEFLFRGTIGNGLTNHNALGGIFASGALFALFHLNPAQTLHQFVLGSFLMLLAYRSSSLWTSIIVHAFNNLAVIVLSYTVEPTGFYQNHGVLAGIVGGVIFVGSVVGYLFTTKNHATTPAEKQRPNGGTWIAFAVALAICVFLWTANLFVE